MTFAVALVTACNARAPQTAPRDSVAEQRIAALQREPAGPVALAALLEVQEQLLSADPDARMSPAFQVGGGAGVRAAVDMARAWPLDPAGWRAELLPMAPCRAVAMRVFRTTTRLRSVCGPEAVEIDFDTTDAPPAVERIEKIAWAPSALRNARGLAALATAGGPHDPYSASLLARAAGAGLEDPLVEGWAKVGTGVELSPGIWAAPDVAPAGFRVPVRTSEQVPEGFVWNVGPDGVLKSMAQAPWIPVAITAEPSLLDEHGMPRWGYSPGLDRLIVPFPEPFFSEQVQRELAARGLAADIGEDGLRWSVNGVERAVAAPRRSAVVQLPDGTRGTRDNQRALTAEAVPPDLCARLGHKLGAASGGQLLVARLDFTCMLEADGPFSVTVALGASIEQPTTAVTETTTPATGEVSFLWSHNGHRYRLQATRPAGGADRLRERVLRLRDGLALDQPSAPLAPARADVVEPEPSTDSAAATGVAAQIQAYHQAMLAAWSGDDPSLLDLVYHPDFMKPGAMGHMVRAQWADEEHRLQRVRGMTEGWVNAAWRRLPDGTITLLSVHPNGFTEVALEEHDGRLKVSRNGNFSSSFGQPRPSVGSLEMHVVEDRGDVLVGRSGASPDTAFVVREITECPEAASQHRRHVQQHSQTEAIHTIEGRCFQVTAVAAADPCVPCERDLHRAWLKVARDMVWVAPRVAGRLARAAARSGVDVGPLRHLGTAPSASTPPDVLLDAEGRIAGEPGAGWQPTGEVLLPGPDLISGDWDRPELLYTSDEPGWRDAPYPCSALTEAALHWLEAHGFEASLDADIVRYDGRPYLVVSDHGPGCKVHLAPVTAVAGWLPPKPQEQTPVLRNAFATAPLVEELRRRTTP